MSMAECDFNRVPFIRKDPMHFTLAFGNRFRCLFPFHFDEKAVPYQIRFRHEQIRYSGKYAFLLEDRRLALVPQASVRYGENGYFRIEVSHLRDEGDLVYRFPVGDSHHLIR